MSSLKMLFGGFVSGHPAPTKLPLLQILAPQMYPPAHLKRVSLSKEAISRRHEPRKMETIISSSRSPPPPGIPFLPVTTSGKRWRPPRLSPSTAGAHGPARLPAPAFPASRPRSLRDEVIPILSVRISSLQRLGALGFLGKKRSEANNADPFYISQAAPPRRPPNPAGIPDGRDGHPVPRVPFLREQQGELRTSPGSPVTHPRSSGRCPRGARQVRLSQSLP